MTLDELLEEIRSRRLILTARGSLWAPNTFVAQDVRRAIWMHRRRLAQLIVAGDIATCPSRDLHRQYWRYDQGRYVCDVCERIAV